MKRDKSITDRRPREPRPAARRPVDRYARLTAADHAALETALQDQLDHWRPLLGLQNWAVTLVSTSLEDCKMKVYAYAEYREADLHYDPFALSHYETDELEEIVVHELMHCRVSEFVKFWKHTDKSGRVALEETLVCDLTQAALRCWRAGVDGDAD